MVSRGATDAVIRRDRCPAASTTAVTTACSETSAQVAAVVDGAERAEQRQQRHEQDQGGPHRARARWVKRSSTRRATMPTKRGGGGRHGHRDPPTVWVPATGAHDEVDPGQHGDEQPGDHGADRPRRRPSRGRPATARGGCGGPGRAGRWWSWGPPGGRDPVPRRYERRPPRPQGNEVPTPAGHPSYCPRRRNGLPPAPETGHGDRVTDAATLLAAYDEQLRTDAETPSALSVTVHGPLRLVTFARRPRLRHLPRPRRGRRGRHPRAGRRRARPLRRRPRGHPGRVEDPRPRPRARAARGPRGGRLRRRRSRSRS